MKKFLTMIPTTLGAVLILNLGGLANAETVKDYTPDNNLVIEQAVSDTQDTQKGQTIKEKRKIALQKDYQTRQNNRV